MDTEIQLEMFMKKNVQEERQWAVKRLFDGEHVDSICISLGRSRVWLYKWAERSLQDDPGWYKSQSRRPHTSPLHTSEEIGEIVKIVRLNLYNRRLLGYMGTHGNSRKYSRGHPFRGHEMSFFGSPLHPRAMGP